MRIWQNMKMLPLTAGYSTAIVLRALRQLNIRESKTNDMKNESQRPDRVTAGAGSASA